MALLLMAVVTTAAATFPVSMTVGRAAGAQQTWWGLWNSSQALSTPGRLEGGQRDQYVRLTAQNSPLLVGGQLHGMRFWIYDKSAVKSASVWMTTSYKSGGEPTVMRQEVAVGELRDYLHDAAATEVMFTEPYDILPAGNPYANILVGFSLDLYDAPQSYMMTGALAGVAGSNFQDSRELSGYGALAMQVLASGPLIGARAVVPQPFEEQVAVAQADGTCMVTMVNQGYEPLSDIGYVVAIDGVEQAIRHYTLPAATDELGLPVTVLVAFDVPSLAQRHVMQVSVRSVNGHDMASPAAASGDVIVLDQPATRRTVMEEFTGTWCLNCVRGLAGIALLQEQFADRFIPIAVHGDERDPMVVADYYQSQFMRDAMKVLGGYPSCVVDRRYYCDPYCGFNTTGTFLTNGIVASVLERPTVADVDVAASWTADGSAITCDVATRFGYSSDTDQYSVVLVVTADGLRGEGSRWNQRNGYNTYSGDDEALLAFAGQGDPMTNMTYNHVAIAVAGVDGGISITSPLYGGLPSGVVTAGETHHFIHAIDMSANQLVQDRQRLSVVAMLLDCRDNTLVNAATAAVTEASGIVEHKGGAEAAGRQRLYDLQGRQVSPVTGAEGSLPRGLYICQGRKVLIK